MPVNAHRSFHHLSLTDKYLVKDFFSFNPRMKCVFSGIPGFIIPLKITCGALKPPSAPAGLFVLLGLTALVQPSGGRVTLLMSVYRVTDNWSISDWSWGWRKGQSTTLKSGRWIALKGEVRGKSRRSTRFTKVIRDRPRKAVRPLVMLWFHVEAQGGRRVQTYRRKR